MFTLSGDKDQNKFAFAQCKSYNSSFSLNMAKFFSDRLQNIWHFNCLLWKDSLFSFLKTCFHSLKDADCSKKQKTQKYLKHGFNQ